jgi:hypothetical protein
MESLDLRHFFSCCFCDFVIVSTLEEKEKYLSSVVRALDNDNNNPQFQQSSANARAHVMRGKMYLDQNNGVAAAHQDAQRAVHLLQSRSSSSLILARAYRLESDVHVQLDNLQAVMDALRNAARVYPPMQTKISKEIGAMQATLAATKQQ